MPPLRLRESSQRHALANEDWLAAVSVDARAASPRRLFQPALSPTNPILAEAAAHPGLQASSRLRRPEGFDRFLGWGPCASRIAVRRNDLRPMGPYAFAVPTSPRHSPSLGLAIALGATLCACAESSPSRSTGSNAAVGDPVPSNLSPLFGPQSNSLLALPDRRETLLLDPLALAEHSAAKHLERTTSESNPTESSDPVEIDEKVARLRAEFTATEQLLCALLRESSPVAARAIPSTEAGTRPQFAYVARPAIADRVTPNYITPDPGLLELDATLLKLRATILQIATKKMRP